MKSIVSVTCSNCGTKFRTSLRKGGKKLARVCPTCGGDRVQVNLPMSSEPEPEPEPA